MPSHGGNTNFVNRPGGSNVTTAVIIVVIVVPPVDVCFNPTHAMYVTPPGPNLARMYTPCTKVGSLASVAGPVGTPHGRSGGCNVWADVSEVRAWGLTYGGTQFGFGQT